MFRHSFATCVRTLADDLHAKLIPLKNRNTFNHGLHWQSHNSDQPDEISSLSEQSISASLKIQDIINNDIGKLFTMCEQLARGIHENLTRSMYKKISETTERTGNTVSVQNGQTAAAFLEMLRKIELGVDEHGNPTMPQLHTSPDTADKLIKALSEQGPEYQAEVNRIKAEKIAQAQERENARRARFRKNHD